MSDCTWGFNSPSEKLVLLQEARDESSEWQNENENVCSLSWPAWINILPPTFLPFSLLSASGQLESWIQLRSENRVSETSAVKAGEDLTKKMLQLYPTLE